MRIAIIGAGNIGGAIASGLMQSSIASKLEIVISDLDTAKTGELVKRFPALKAVTDNQSAVTGSDITILAVKPWLVEPVLTSLKFEKGQILASVAAGVTFSKLVGYVSPSMTIFRIIPNTAIRKRESMSLIASLNATEEQEKEMLGLFSELGMALPVKEAQMEAGTALASCGIAYVLKYIQAATEAGVEMGLYPHDAMMMVAQSVKGAAALLLDGNSHPAIEIDKVTTPGGITIKGINELDHNGFASAVIKAIKVSR